jgi:cytochrome c-type biogenesis protein CcmH
MLKTARTWVPPVRVFGPGKARISTRLSFFVKFSQALLLAIAVCFSLGASDAPSRLYNLSHRTMCTCGCAEILGECNHVGCSESTEELGIIRSGISGGLSDQQILDTMVARYGAVVLAAPTTHGFNLVAWIAPFAVLAAGILGVVLLVKHWTVGRVPVPATASDPSMDTIREKIRRETEASDL